MNMIIFKKIEKKEGLATIVLRQQKSFNEIPTYLTE